MLSWRNIFKLILFLLLGADLESHAKTIVPFDKAHWQINAQVGVPDSFEGKSCFKLINGTMELNDHSFVNGTIDFDIAFPKARCFPGIRFRMKDTANGEVYYLRPHQSGNPDAMQYYPRYNGWEGWQLYYGEGFNTAYVYPFDQWLHLHMIIKGSQAEIYFDNEKEPAFFISSLKRPVASGGLILFNESETTVRYANFSYEKTDDIVLKSPPRSVPQLSSNVFTVWQVSSPFDESRVINKPLLNTANFSGLAWQKLNTTDQGIADLSQLSSVVSKKNTVFARLIIHANKRELKKFSFGFSDRARLYFNKRLLYSGENNYRSRDYRFLGTIGFFDAVYLQLENGNNEVWIAVSEDSGGWGIEAKMEDPSGWFVNPPTMNNIPPDPGKNPILVNTCLITGNVDRLVNFYEPILGISAKRSGKDYAEFPTGNGVLAIFSETTQEKYIPGSAEAANNKSMIMEFRVANVDHEYKRLQGLIQTWVKIPAKTAWGTRSMYFRDPDGNLVDFYELPKVQGK